MNVARIREIEQILNENGITHQEISQMLQNGDLEIDLEPMCIESMDEFSADFQDAFKDKFCTLESFYVSYDDDQILEEFVKAGNYNSILSYVDQRSTKDPNGDDFVKVGISFDCDVYTVRIGDKSYTNCDPDFYQNFYECFLNFYTPIEKPGEKIHHRLYYMNKSFVDVIFDETSIAQIDKSVEEMTNPVTRMGYRISKNEQGYEVTRFHVGNYGKQNLDIKPYKNLKSAQNRGKKWIA